MGMAIPRRAFVSICMECFPGVRQIAGVNVSHGYCRLHGLGLMKQNGLATRAEIFELWVRRHWIILVALLATIALGVGAQSRTTEIRKANGPRPTPDHLRKGAKAHLRDTTRALAAENRLHQGMPRLHKADGGESDPASADLSR